MISDDHKACDMLNDQMTAYPENMGVTNEMQLAVDKWPNLISTGPTCSGVLPIETHDTLGNSSPEDEQYSVYHAKHSPTSISETGSSDVSAMCNLNPNYEAFQVPLGTCLEALSLDQNTNPKHTHNHEHLESHIIEWECDSITNPPDDGKLNCCSTNDSSNTCCRPCQYPDSLDLPVFYEAQVILNSQNLVTEQEMAFEDISTVVHAGKHGRLPDIKPDYLKDNNYCYLKIWSKLHCGYKQYLVDNLLNNVVMKISMVKLLIEQGCIITQDHEHS